MRRWAWRAAVSSAAALAATPLPAPAGLVAYHLGEQDFAHGDGPILVKQAAAAGANEAFPFDGTVFGDDRTRKFGKVSFTYHYQPPAVPSAGTLTIGLLGLDSPPGTPGTVRLFLDGVEQPSDAFAGASSAVYRSSASVVRVPVSAALLGDGELTVAVKAFRHGPGYPGNAIEADFSTLTFADVAGSPGGGPDDGGNPGGPPGGIPGGGTTDPGGGSGGQDPGPDPYPGGGNGGGGGGSGGGASEPPPQAVPLPPAVLAGVLGLALAAAMRRKA